MSNIAIRVENLGKRYRIGKAVRHHSGRRPLFNTLAAPFRYLTSTLCEPTPDEIFWALKDVSFEVRRGEVVGIIGRNGAGKSTLLKILSRITEPTEGRAVLRGRVGSLLEVGTGFNPELTGRENVYLNGAILGMKKAEISRKFDEIVDFSGVEKFIDTPVKRYSSGMKVRLAFAVAAHLEPEILLIDEVLAVGDAAFQKKCLGKMGDVAREGRTVLFVSHNMQAVRGLCSRTMHIERGQIVREGNTQSIIEGYLAADDTGQAELRWNEPDSQLGDEQFRLQAVRILDHAGQTTTRLRSGQPIRIQIEFDLQYLHPSFGVGFDLFTSDGTMVFRTYHFDETQDKWPELTTGFNCLECVIPPGILNAGRYIVKLCVLQMNIKWILNDEPEMTFEVELDHPRSPFYFAVRRGVIAPIMSWQRVPIGDGAG